MYYIYEDNLKIIVKYSNFIFIRRLKIKVTKETTLLIYRLENIIGNECYNPNSYDGYTGTKGCRFRYPVYAKIPDEDNDEDKKYTWLINEFVDPCSLKYNFGSNHLLIGNGLLNVLNYLEKRYNLDFNKLEEEATASKK